MDNAKPRVVTSTTKGLNCREFIPSCSTIVLICFFILCLLMNGDITPLTKRGFFCNDVSISKPYHLDTIGIKTLLFVALVLPCVVIKICDKSFEKSMQTSLSRDRQRESMPRLPRKSRKISDAVEELDVEEEELISNPIKVKRRNLILIDNNNQSIVTDQELPVKIGNELDENEIEDDEETNLFTRVPLDSDQEQSDSNNQLLSSRAQNEGLLRKFSELQLFFFGLCTTMLFTGIGKITCGRLRPHFLQRCQPDVDCSEIENPKRYIEEYNCTNSQLKPSDFSYITTSWPSETMAPPGHASIMFYSMLYLIFYLNNVVPVLIQLSSRKVKQRYDPLLMYSVYILMIALAGFIAMTRISDYHHHPLDVVSGSLIGSIIAITFSKTLSKHYSLLSVIQH